MSVTNTNLEYVINKWYSLYKSIEGTFSVLGEIEHDYEDSLSTHNLYFSVTLKNGHKHTFLSRFRKSQWEGTEFHGMVDRWFDEVINELFS